MKQSELIQTGRDAARAICDYSECVHAANLRDAAQFTYWRAFVLANAVAARAGRIVPSDWQSHVFLVYRAQRLNRINR